MTMVDKPPRTARHELAPIPTISYDDSGGPRSLRIIAPIVTAALVLGVWTFVSEVVVTGAQRFLLPSPWAVLQGGFLDAAARSEILAGLWSTMQVALVGLALSIAIGVSLAIIMSQARWIEASIYPYAIILQTIPILAIVPLMGFWFGYEMTSRVIVCILVAVFPIITNTLFGLRSVDRSLHDQFSLWRATRLQRLLRLQLPAALPAMATGLKISAGMAVVGSIIADFFFRQGHPGIGRLIDNYLQTLQTDLMIAALLYCSAAGIILFLFFDALLRFIEAQRSPSRH